MDKTKEVIKDLSLKSRPQKLVPIATNMFLPNHSGSHDAGILNKTPTKENDLVNKDYVDNLVVADHGTASTDQVVNVCYGTGDPPAANTTTEGTLFIKYTA